MGRSKRGWNGRRGSSCSSGDAHEIESQGPPAAQRIILHCVGAGTGRRRHGDVILEEINVKAIEYVGDDSGIVRKRRRQLQIHRTEIREIGPACRAAHPGAHREEIARLERKGPSWRERRDGPRSPRRREFPGGHQRVARRIGRHAYRRARHGNTAELEAEGTARNLSTACRHEKGADSR